jgi:hypothetical protein
MNNSLGIFIDMTLSHMPGQSYDTRDMQFADFDRDGDLDIVSALGPLQNNMILVNQGHRQFGVVGAFLDSAGLCLPDQTYSKNTQGVAVTDVDNDGDIDIVFANKSYQNRLWINMGAAQGGVFGCFVDNTVVAFPVDLSASACVVAGDVDNDGDNDLVFGITNSDFFCNILKFFTNHLFVFCDTPNMNVFFFARRKSNFFVFKSSL